VVDETRICPVCEGAGRLTDGEYSVSCNWCPGDGMIRAGSSAMLIFDLDDAEIERQIGWIRQRAVAAGRQAFRIHANRASVPAAWSLGKKQECRRDTRRERGQSSLLGASRGYFLKGGMNEPH
jgi:hypothetical protein